MMMSHRDLAKMKIKTDHKKMKAKWKRIKVQNNLKFSHNTIENPNCKSSIKNIKLKPNINFINRIYIV